MAHAHVYVAVQVNPVHTMLSQVQQAHRAVTPVSTQHSSNGSEKIRTTIAIMLSITILIVFTVKHVADQTLINRLIMI